MRRLYILIFAALIVFGCKKNEVDLTFGETPEERISEGISELKTTLIGAENGWVGLLNTVIGGGYGFYIKFNEDETLQMLMDGNDSGLSDYNSSDELQKSTFRVKHVMGISLLFDTYNYLTLLQDPVPGVAWGLPGVGLGSDVDFELMKYSANRDTVYLRGKKHSNSLVLYKATKDEQSIFLTKEYPTSIDKTNTYFDPLGANYFELNGVKVQVILNNATKDAGLVMLDVAADTLSYKSESYAYTPQGFDFIASIPFQGKEFTKVRLEGDKYYLYDASGSKYVMNYSDEQIISLKYAIGVSINQLVVPGPQSFPGQVPLPSWSTSFNTHWNSFISQAIGGPYRLTIGNTFYTFDVVNKRINVTGVIYQNNGASAYGTSYQYTYDFTPEGNMKFTGVGNANGNASIIIPYMNNSYHTRMLSDTFMLGYDIDPSFGKLVKFTSIENPTYYFTMIIN